MTAATFDMVSFGDLLNIAFKESGGAKNARLQQTAKQYGPAKIAGRVSRLLARRSSSKSRIGGAMGQKQAVVKTVYKGGVKNASQLATQLNYLTRDGSLDMSVNGGQPLDDIRMEAIAESWVDGFSGKTEVGYTRHMIISYPAGTHAEAAEMAAETFARDVFGSGKFGDRWDYLSVFHNDTDNPHMHLVINNRGVENGKWLSMNSASEMNSDALRAIQVETGAEYGIEMVATSRIERGLTEDAVANLRHNQNELSEPEAAAREIAAAIFAREQEAVIAMASELGNISGVWADTSQGLSASVRPDTYGASPMADTNTQPLVEQPASESIDRITNAINQKVGELKDMLSELGDVVESVDDPEERAEYERLYGEQKGTYAHLLGENDNLPFTVESTVRDGDLIPTPALDQLEGRYLDEWNGVKASVERDALGLGLDPETSVARWMNPEPVRVGTVLEWTMDEIERAKGSGLVTGDDEEIGKRLDDFRTSLVERGRDITELVRTEGLGVDQEVEAAQELADRYKSHDKSRDHSHGTDDDYGI